MSTLVFVIVFIVIALGVFFVAMSGGRSGKRGRRGGTRTSRRLAVVGFVVALLVLGAGVPAAVIALVKNRDDIPGNSSLTLTASEKRGQLLFGERCAACHTLKAANASASVGPDFDQLRPPKALILDAIKHGRARGNGQMPALIYEGQDAQDVANFVAKVAGRAGS